MLARRIGGGGPFLPSRKSKACRSRSRHRGGGRGTRRRAPAAALDELVKRIPPRPAVMDELFRAKFTTVKRMQQKGVERVGSGVSVDPRISGWSALPPMRWVAPRNLHADGGKPGAGRGPRAAVSIATLP